MNAKRMLRMWCLLSLFWGGTAGSTFAAQRRPNHHRSDEANAEGRTKRIKAESGELDRKTPFIVFEHIHNPGRPADLTTYGLVPIELCYNTKTKESLQASVKSKYDKGGGPIVFDIEKTNRNDHDVSTRHLKEVLRWAHEAVPDGEFGFYAVGPSNLTPLKKPVEKEVDAFFPSLYVHNTNRRAWEHTARKLVRQGHRHHKPVYLFLMSKFHGRVARDVPQAFWAFQLHAALRAGADGVVIWSSGRDKWNERAGWWQATKAFTENLKAAQATKGNGD